MRWNYLTCSDLNFWRCHPEARAFGAGGPQATWTLHRRSMAFSPRLCLWEHGVGGAFL